jgi:hypothetical protein
VLQVAATFILVDARENEITFELMNKEGAFQRLVYLISTPKEDEEAAMHRLLMELLYEMSRIQKITINDLSSSLPMSSNCVALVYGFNTAHTNWIVVIQCTFKMTL